MKNNAKKRRMYEAFMETLPLLTSLEVCLSFVPMSAACMHGDSHCQPPVLSPAALRENEGGGRHILQGVRRRAADYRSGDGCMLTIRTKNNNNIRSLHLVSHRVFVLQGDSADCFYIVESGQVRIAMKRSRVCFNVFAFETLTIKSSSLAGVRHS